MSNAALPKELALSLLKHLASDDDFRTRFEADPKEGLREIGVPVNLVANLPEHSLAPLKLAEKARFATLHKQLLSSEDASEWRCMSGPNPLIGLSDASVCEMRLRFSIRRSCNAIVYAGVT